MIFADGMQMQDMSTARAIRLNELTQDILQAISKKEFYRVSVRLVTVQGEKLYLEGGYKSIYAYGKAVLGYKQASVANYLSVGKKYINPETFRSIFAEGMRDIGFTQLLELLRITPDEAMELYKSGAFTMDSTAKQIKGVVAAFKAQKDKDKADEEKAMREPLERAYEDFHKAYNELKAHLQEIGDSKGADELLPRIMDDVVVLYAERLLKEY